jgi:PilZ domain
MESADSRHISRESMFLMADLRLEGQGEAIRVKVRNLSNGGMMAEGSIRVVPGALVSVNLRNIGWVDGAVAWVQDSRFGIAFRQEVEARLARLRATEVETEVPRFVRPVLLDEGAKGNQPLRKL